MLDHLIALGLPVTRGNFRYGSSSGVVA